MEKLIIIGGGPAGLAGAIYASRDGLNPLVFAGPLPGGQPMLTSVVENYPGHEKILGPDLVGTMRKQAISFGTKIVDKNVVKVDFSKRPFSIFISEPKSGSTPCFSPASPRRTSGPLHGEAIQGEPKAIGSNRCLRLYSTKSVIITTGAKVLWLNLPSEQRLIGKGVSACANCDGFFFRDKTVAVVGGGDTALEESLSLTKYAKKVYIIHRRDHFRASKVIQNKVFTNPKIKVIWNAVVEEVLGRERVEGIKLESIKLNVQRPTLNELKIDGLFVAIGYKPDTDLFEGQVEMDERGYILTNSEFLIDLISKKTPNPNNSINRLGIGNSLGQLDQLEIRNYNYRQMTSVKGVFAGGDCIDPKYKQLATAIGSGVAAAVEADKWLESVEIG